MNESGHSICVLARISMRTSQDGGKTKPYTMSFRPNHNFGESENTKTFIGQVEVPDGTCIVPGGAYDLIVRFVEAPGLSDLLQIGRIWRIQEGKKLVANAQVLRRHVSDRGDR